MKNFAWSLGFASAVAMTAVPGMAQTSAEHIGIKPIVNASAFVTNKEYVDVATNKQLFVPGVVIVKLREGVTQPPQVGFMSEEIRPSFGVGSLQEKFVTVGASGLEQIFPPAPVDAKLKKRKRAHNADALWKGLERIYRIHVANNADVVKVAALFAQDPNVEYAEPEAAMYSTALDPACAEELAAANDSELNNTPNDPDSGRLHYLNQIGAPLAWSAHKGEEGTEEIRVGIVDSGLRWYHPDLVENIHQNLGEDANGNGRVIEFVNNEWRFDPGDVNGRDDDGDGRIDNFVGWNFVPGTNGFAANDPDDRNGHGTHVGGSAAARTNNGIGVPAISWNVKIVPSAHGGTGPNVANGYEGIRYCAQQGADVINCSWGGPGGGSFGRDIIAAAAAQGILVITAAGNENTSELSYPAAYQGAINIASVNRNDRKASYSNFNNTVMFSAPGGEGTGSNGIYSTYIGPQYASLSGTSMASPVAASCFALLKSFRPDWSREQIIEQMLNTADDITALNPSFAGQLGKRINIGRALTEIGVEVIDFDVVEENNNYRYEPNETLTLKSITMDLRGLAGGNRTFRLRSDDPTITILDSVHTGTYPSSVAEVQTNYRIKLSDQRTNVRIITLSILIENNGNVLSTAKIDLLAGEGGVVIHERSRGGLTGGSAGLIYDVLRENRPGVRFVLSTNRLLNYGGAHAVFIANTSKAMAALTARDAASFERYFTEKGNVYMDGLYPFATMDTNLRNRFMAMFGLREIVTGLDPEGFSRPLSGSSGGFTGSNTNFASALTPIPQDMLYSLRQSTGNRIFLRQEIIGTVGVQTFNQEKSTKTLLLSPYTVNELVDGTSNKRQFVIGALQYFDVPDTEVVSVSEQQGENIVTSIYPNPTVEGRISLNLFNNNGGEVEVRFYDYVGREVLPPMSVILTPGVASQVSVQTAALPAGTYYVRCTKNGQLLQTASFVQLR